MPGWVLKERQGDTVPEWARFSWAWRSVLMRCNALIGVIDKWLWPSQQESIPDGRFGHQP